MIKVNWQEVLLRHTSRVVRRSCLALFDHCSVLWPAHLSFSPSSPFSSVSSSLVCPWRTSRCLCSPSPMADLRLVTFRISSIITHPPFYLLRSSQGLPYRRLFDRFLSTPKLSASMGLHAGRQPCRLSVTSFLKDHSQLSLSQIDQTHIERPTCCLQQVRPNLPFIGCRFSAVDCVHPKASSSVVTNFMLVVDLRRSTGTQRAFSRCV